MVVKASRLPDPPISMEKAEVEYIHDLLREIEITFKSISDMLDNFEDRIQRVSALNP